MDTTLDWLLEGDPAIRWQTQRDLLDAPATTWQTEQARVATEGWGAQLLAMQDHDGRWGGGLYSPKWISTTYTLLLLRDLGLPRHHAAAQRGGAALVIDGLLGARCDDAFRKKLAECDRCIVGMILALVTYFAIDDDGVDARVDAIIENMLAEVMPDGAWNCRKHRRPYPHHSSFHTTLNVLDGVRGALEFRPSAYEADLLQAEARAVELLLRHQLFRSDKSGNIIHPKFLKFSHPHYWHYDAFRALDYLARAQTPRDPRAQAAIDLLQEKQRDDGTWTIENRYSGKVYFHMESQGKPSRWNTLRARRILRWWQGDR